MIETIASLEGTPSLLMHSCCAPCSSSVIATLSERFSITVFYFNPNIDDAEEYEKRKREQIRFIGEFPAKYPIAFLDCEYDASQFLAAAAGHEGDREGGERCTSCYRLRIDRTALEAARGAFDFFATTLTVSPLKDATRINEIGIERASARGARWLCSDFKKNDGYKRSIELSSQYRLYRQNFCGCSFSRRNAGEPSGSGGN